MDGAAAMAMMPVSSSGAGPFRRAPPPQTLSEFRVSSTSDGGGLACAAKSVCSSHSTSGSAVGLSPTLTQSLSNSALLVPLSSTTGALGVECDKGRPVGTWGTTGAPPAVGPPRSPPGDGGDFCCVRSAPMARWGNGSASSPIRQHSPYYYVPVADTAPVPGGEAPAAPPSWQAARSGGPTPVPQPFPKNRVSVHIASWGSVAGDEDGHIAPPENDSSPPARRRPSLSTASGKASARHRQLPRSPVEFESPASAGGGRSGRFLPNLPPSATATPDIISAQHSSEPSRVNHPGGSPHGSVVGHSERRFGDGHHGSVEDDASRGSREAYSPPQSYASSLNASGRRVPYIRPLIRTTLKAMSDRPDSASTVSTPTPLPSSQHQRPPPTTQPQSQPPPPSPQTANEDPSKSKGSFNRTHLFASLLSLRSKKEEADGEFGGGGAMLGPLSASAGGDPADDDDDADDRDGIPGRNQTIKQRRRGNEQAQSSATTIDYAMFPEHVVVTRNELEEKRRERRRELDEQGRQRRQAIKRKNRLEFSLGDSSVALGKEIRWLESNEQLLLLHSMSSSSAGDAAADRADEGWVPLAPGPHPAAGAADDAEEDEPVVRLRARRASHIQSRAGDVAGSAAFAVFHGNSVQDTTLTSSQYFRGYSLTAQGGPAAPAPIRATKLPAEGSERTDAAPADDGVIVENLDDYAHTYATAPVAAAAATRGRPAPITPAPAQPVGADESESGSDDQHPGGLMLFNNFFSSRVEGGEEEDLPSLSVQSFRKRRE